MNLGQTAGSCFLDVEAIDLFQVGLDGGGAKLLNRRFVHTSGKVVSDLLLIGIAALRLTGQVAQNAPQEPFIVLRQLGVDGPSGLIGGNRDSSSSTPRNCTDKNPHRGRRWYP